MTLRFIFYLIVLIASVWLGVYLVADPSYAILGNDKGWIEMPLWFLAFAFVVIFIALHTSFRVINYTSKMGGRLQHWTVMRRLSRAHKATSKGLIELAEGNWKQAERYLVKNADNTDSPLINYLAAARAAQARGRYDQRDDYLRKALDCTPEAEIAVGLTQAQLQLNHQQLEQSLATLRHLRSLVPKHTYVLNMLQSLYVMLKDWDSLADLLPELYRYEVLPKQELQQLERQVAEALLLKSIKENISWADIQIFWQGLAKHLKRDPSLVQTYASYLYEIDEKFAAEEVILNYLKRQWHDSLVEFYGTLESLQPEKQLSYAENWLKEQGNNPVLLLALGRIAKRNHLWGKAKDYLHQCISLSNSPTAYRELGQLHEHLQEIDDARECYREGLLNL